MRLARQGSPGHSYMVVLQYDDKIDTNGVLEKYGKHFFWRRRMRKPLLALIMVLLLMLLFLPHHRPHRTILREAGSRVDYPWWATCLCLVLSFPVIYLKTQRR